ncbi:PREDICTED: homocysteine-responsive endoplasmic reticulum-resident ubiquitin-like domain member 2 protein [Priapulus caudatus]|uniref:Homocysteine-responsive endoplasmic reticulum-resident ubiquitin-like domain member 2 protein n=1 Tax=Priapulus caudatus TaxID=37621 RepID=A0ABM1F428_PRICU|nr:PREDICTED: homocysteine-responsive endoplasmic reticulum-resident ubiquitin-like domain member 2 protein [Priapulus caudatus]XP_014679193.1 PREDICTED: homocysteine-responsive endoplasmic reticulum-resident ubiquitin-like domain member 2 protein [Priapulus caudatus]XP_014679199.1 PREDICTED: homocysteine-responsive endoplasmic reticulum-resident ubiquitin-like domain member 2 protein [Priapulus caudatus]
MDSDGISLVIKAPNMKVQDHIVECDMGWTVQQLKAHLAKDYPGEPAVERQKLIYSGQLLPDHLTLKDFLRQYDEDTRTHTLHLVCAQMKDQLRDGPVAPKPNVKPAASAGVATSTSAPSTSQQLPQLPEGLRHRLNTAPTPSPPTSQNQQWSNYTQLQQMAAQYQHNPYQGLTPEQQYWVYAQYMQQYMYYAQMGFPVANMMSYAATVQPNVAPGNNVPGPQAQQGLNNAAGNQNVRMDAQGNAVLDDDEEEHANDWLDWIYTFCRVSILFSILYFYSSLSRFVVVLTCFFFFYLYQKGFFMIARRVNANNNRVQAPQRQPQQQEQQPDNLQQGGQAEEAQQEVAETEQNTDPVRIQQSEPPQPSPLATMWTFLVTFFSSLIPERPLPVNAN